MPHQGIVLTKLLEAGAPSILAVRDAIEIHAKFEPVRSRPIDARQIDIRDPLIAPGESGGVDELISPPPVRYQPQEFLSLRNFTSEGAVQGITKLDQRAPREIDLVLQIEEPLARSPIHGGFRRIQCAQPGSI